MQVWVVLKTGRDLDWELLGGHTSMVHMVTKVLPTIISIHMSW
jgi:hypothetical protein